MVHCIVQYIVQYIVHYMVHCIMHYMVHHMVHYEVHCMVHWLVHDIVQYMTQFTVHYVVLRLGESAALRVLAGEPNVHPVGKQRRARESLCGVQVWRGKRDRRGWRVTPQWPRNVLLLATLLLTPYYSMAL